VKIGIVSVWWNRGQATVARHLRSIFHQLGHETFVLARPSRGFPGQTGFISSTDVWDQRNITHASDFFVPNKEYVKWAKRAKLEVIFFDMNFQFEPIAKLRSMGIKTIGRFVWERFKPEHVEEAKEAFSVIYSLTLCEQARYARLGIQSPYVQWGCHPELVAFKSRKFEDGIYFFFPAGYQGPRKPLKCVVQAFKKARNPNLKLIIKAQGFRRKTEEIEFKDEDGITRIVSDCTTEEYLKLFSSCHVCLAPSRWEGLGLHLVEATAFGMPVITNDIPPMNELITDGYNGRLVTSHQIGHTMSGIPSYDPDIDDLCRAIEELSEPSRIEEMSRNASAVRDRLSWDKTIEQMDRLLNT